MRTITKITLIGLVCLTVWTSSVQAQQSLADLWIDFLSSQMCTTKKSNVQGVAGADVIITSTLKTVIAARADACGAVLINNSPTQTLRCRGPEDGPATLAAGFKMEPKTALGFTVEIRTGLQCILDSTATGNGALSVLEVWP